MGRRLTPKQERFCVLYHASGNGYQSYLEAYPASQKWKRESVDQVAHRLLNNVKIVSRLKELNEAQEKLSQITKMEVLKEHIDIIKTDVSHILTVEPGGGIYMKVLDDIDKDRVKSIKSVKSKRTLKESDSGDSVILNDNVEYTLYDKQKSLDSIAKLLGYYEAENVNINTGVINIKQDELLEMTEDEIKALSALEKIGRKVVIQE